MYTCRSAKSLVVAKQTEELSAMTTVLAEDWSSLDEQSRTCLKRNTITSHIQSKSMTCSECALNTNYNAKRLEDNYGHFYTGDGVPCGHKCNIPEVPYPRVHVHSAALLMCTSCNVRQKSEYRTPLYKMCEDVFHIEVFKHRYINKIIFYQWKPLYRLVIKWDC